MSESFAGDSSFFLDLYARYARDPNAVPADWRVYFEGLEDRGGHRADPHQAAEQLAEAYRRFGHMQAGLDPLGLVAPQEPAEIAEAKRKFGAAAGFSIAVGDEAVTDAGSLLDRLSATYGGTAAIEAAHVPESSLRSWVHQCFEREMNRAPDEALLGRSLEAIFRADEFEKFLRTKWPTKKRFGLEGAETMVVFLREAFRSAALEGCREVVIGGMHRGRLATLATVLGKSLAALLAEIKGHDETEADPAFTGDVPYHKGLRSTVETDGGALDVRLLPHPSHLIVVAPVAVGAARGRQEIRAGSAAESEAGRRTVLPLMMHTDAAFAGQGLISELLQLGGLAGYSVGGTIHLVVNNQIGFTTTPAEGRSTAHPTDIGKAFGIPILHVNADAPLAVAAAARTAVAWRYHAGRDCLINLVCYRRNGHNELDEPRFTQPTMWSAIDAHPPVAATFAAAVAEAAPAAAAAADAERAAFHGRLDHAYATYDQHGTNHSAEEAAVFDGDRKGGPVKATAATGVARGDLLALTRTICEVPEGFGVDPKVGNFLRSRLRSIEEDSGFNMATAEALAFASLLSEDVSVRLSGQDCVRGTFTQRHLGLHDPRTGQSIIPVARAAKGNARFDAVNSPLTEYGVLSFEYGLSLADHRRLTVWEAQFGDFLNGAQVVVDQFIVTAEAKWRMPSRLVLALPHGLEGQGPDHSSARIERILQSCAYGNLLVAHPSTPASLFHLYRRQILSDTPKPLFLIAPKSLLRLPDAVSHLADIEAGSVFRPVIVHPPKAKRCRRMILCTGKVAYPLLKSMNDLGADDVALIRIEQLYPFPLEEVLAAIRSHRGAEIVWCQEEPRNQGAWSFVRELFADEAPEIAFRYAGRPPMAAAAGGSIDRHELEQAELVADAVGREPVAIAGE